MVVCFFEKWNQNAYLIQTWVCFLSANMNEGHLSNSVKVRPIVTWPKKNEDDQLKLGQSVTHKWPTKTESTCWFLFFWFFITMCCLVKENKIMKKEVAFAYCRRRCQLALLAVIHCNFQKIDSDYFYWTEIKYLLNKPKNYNNILKLILI